MEEQQEKRTSNDEIDLKELFQSIGNFFKNMFINIMLFFVQIKKATFKNLMLIIAFGVIGGVAGIGLNYVSIDYYESSMVLRSTYLTGRLMESSIDKLDQLSAEENHEQLAKTLKINLSIAEKIKSFRYEPFINEDEVIELEVFKEQLRSEIKDEETINKFVDKLKSENRNTYRIYVQVYDNTVISQIQEPILNYFKNNPFVQKRLKITEENLVAQKAQIQEEMSKLDSLKNLIFNNFISLSSSKSGSNNVILSEENIANPVEVISKISSNYIDLLNINRKLYLDENFELIDGFIAYNKPESPGLLKYGFYSGLIGLGIAYILIALMAFNNYLNKIEESYSTN